MTLVPIVSKLLPKLLPVVSMSTSINACTTFEMRCKFGPLRTQPYNCKRSISTTSDVGVIGGGGLLGKLLSQARTNPQKNLGRCYADWKGLPGQERITFLTDKNIESVIRSSSSLLIMFYAPWCGHCRSSKPEYARAGQMLATERPSAQLAAIDCMIYPSIYEKYDIVGYPTFKYYNGGRLVGEYHHRRKASDFVHFMLREPKSRGDL